MVAFELLLSESRRMRNCGSLTLGRCRENEVSLGAHVGSFERGLGLVLNDLERTSGRFVGPKSRLLDSRRHGISDAAMQWGPL